MAAVRSQAGTARVVFDVWTTGREKMLVQVNGQFVNPFGWLCPGPTVPANDVPDSGVVIAYLNDVAIMKMVCAGAANDDDFPKPVTTPVIIRPAAFRPRLRLCRAEE